VYVTRDGTWLDASKPASAGPLYLSSSGDLAVPGDYDGDGTWDVAVVTPGGDWITHSDAGTMHFPAPPQLPAFLEFQPLDAYQTLPVPGAYDGHGKVEPAWFRGADATWFIAGHDPIVFGKGPTNPDPRRLPANDRWDQDQPVPADYDGDGITDLSTYNPRTRVWRVRSSRTGATSDVTMPGSATLVQVPMPADYDGVHHAQRAVYGPYGWSIEGHAAIDPFGAYADARSPIMDPWPAAADYDGDGKADLSYVDSSGVWHIRSSADPSTVTTYDIGTKDSAVAPIPVALPSAVANEIARVTLVAHNCVPSGPSSPNDC
jgi:hypothetical protein